MPSFGFCCFQRPKGVAEGGKEGNEHEELVHEEEEVKQERIDENEKGKEVTKMSNEKNRESGDEEKPQDTPEQGKDKGQWSKEDLQGRFSPDGDR